MHSAILPRMKLHTVMENAPALFANKMHDGRPVSVLLHGDPGGGKTQMMQNILAPRLEQATGKRVTTLIERPAERDGSEYGGIPVPVPQGEGKTRRYITARTTPDIIVAIQAAVEENPDGIVILTFDEFGQADTLSQKVIATIANEGELTGYKIPSNVWVWGTTNFSDNGAGVGKMLTHLNNRLAHFAVYPDVGYWIKHFALSNALLPGAIAWADQNRGSLEKPTVAKDGPYLTVRSFTYGVNALKSIKQARGDTDPRTIPDDEFAVATLAGFIGQEHAQQFMAIAPVMEKLPKPADIYRDPAGTPVPQASDFYLQFPLQSVLINLLLGNPTPEQQMALLEYTSRLSPDLASGVFAVAHNPREGRSVLGSPAAQQFVAQHVSLFTAISQAV